VWVANFDGDSVTELDSDGAPLAYFDNANRPGAGFDHPHRIAVDPFGNIWVLNHRAMTKLSQSGVMLGRFQPHGPRSFGRMLAFDQKGEAWVTDQDGLMVINRDGKLLAYYNNGNAPGAGFRSPGPIAIDKDHIWIGNTQAGSLTLVMAPGVGSQFFPYGGPGRSTGPQWPTAR
jgi:streptogramin lyase